MKARFLSFLLLLLLLLLLSLAPLTGALSYPTVAPPGEMTGGTYRNYFDNIFANYGSDCDTYGQVIGGFTSTGVPICVSPVSSGLFLSGQTSGDTIRFNGTDWVRTNLIYNDGTYIGIGKTNPSYALDVAGTGAFMGFRLPTGAASGNVLVSDASGNAYWAASFSGTYAASGITGGTQDYLTKFGTSGNGLTLSQIFDNGTSIGIGTATPSASVKLDIIGDILLNSLRLGRGPGNTISNTVFGWNALAVNISGTTDTAIGYGALSALTSGDGNIGIGNLAGSTFVSGNNNIFIGNNTQPNISAAGSNQLNIGNWIYGDSGNIGIGAANPGAKLEVNGQIKITGGGPGSGYVLVSDSSGLATWQAGVPASTVDATNITNGVANYIPKFGTGGTGIFASTIYQSTGYIGIANTNPSVELDVNGRIRMRTGAGSGLVLLSDGSGTASWGTVTASTVSASGVINGTQGYLPYFTTGGNGLISSLIFQTGSFIGINSTSPAYTLQVNGTGSFSGFRLPTGSSNGYILTSDASGNASWQAAAAGVNGGQTNYTARWLSATTLGTGSLSDNGTNVGIGVPTASYKLEVAGTGSFSGFRLPTGAANGRLLMSDASGNASWTGFIVANSLSITGSVLGYTLYYDGTNWIPSANIYHTGSNVGIGTATPGAKLEVNGQVKITGGSPGLNKVLISDATGLASWINPTSSLSGSFWTLSGNTASTSDFLGTTNNQDLRFYTNNTQKMVLTSAGRLGIGVVTPTTASLEVSGATLISGDLTVQGKVVTDTVISRTVANVTVSGSIFPDQNAPLIYRDIGTSTGRWNNLYLSGQISIGGGSPGLNKILTSDATGLASWSSVFSGNTLATGITGGASGYLSLFGSSGNGLISSLIFQTGSFIGINSTSPAYTLQVNGTGSFSGFRLPTGGGTGRILMSDPSGNAYWSTGFSGSLSASGITGGVENIVPKFGTGGTGLVSSQITDSGGTVFIGTGTTAFGAKLVIDSGIDDDSGLRFAQVDVNSALTSNGVVALGVNGSGKVMPISPISNIAVYTGVLRTTALSPNPDLNTFNVTYNFNQYFAIPGKQSFVVSKGDGPSYNGPYFKEDGVSALCSQTGAYTDASFYNCSTSDPVTGLSASPYNSFTMTAKGDSFGYQLALGARGDAPLFARSGRFNGAQTGGLFTNDSPYQTPAPWQRVLSVPANHPEYLYINTGLNSQLQAQAGGGRVAIGTTFPQSRFEVWSGATSESLLHFRGTDNVGMGLAATNSGVTGSRNSGFGAYALDLITSGGGNTALGYRAGRNITTGSNNIMIGSGANALVATGSNQLNIGNWIYGTGGFIGIGTGALRSMFEVWSGSTTNSSFLHFRGTNNTAFGYGAVKSNLSGNANTGIGAEALYTLSSGYSNTAIGYKALRLTLAGFNNTAVGQEALYNNNGGSWNAADGYQALYSSSSGTGNTALGAQSLYNLSTGDNNTAVGFQALRVIAGSSVRYNTAIGVQALYSTTASNLTAVGYRALYSNSSGTGNLGMGYQSLYTVTTGYNNTALGYNTAVNATGSQNTIIGANAGSNLTSGSDNIIIGADTNAITATGSSQLNIGDWIYGNGGNIGIGVSNPTRKLDVGGTVKLGTAGTTITNAGVCTIASTAITTTATAYTCTGLPASTSVAIHCNAAAAFTTPNTTSLYCRPNGSANSVTCNTTVANSVATTYTCMWMQ